MRTRIRLAAVAAVLIALVITMASAQVNLTFEKSSVGDGVWMGTVSGDVTGQLVTTLMASDQSQPVWKIVFYWIVLADDPSQSFIARMTGTLDTTTGAVTMAGRVIDGYQAGARVREVGQLQNAENSSFIGTIRVVAEIDPYAEE
ncbi:MAG TPA: hypothetical protein VFD39_04855 [Trueperaceae bacterium]|nr:hypothetical protein [Trueperaceae bacterium]